MERILVVAVAVVALAAGTVVPASGQEAAPTPVIHATPTTDLVDGQVVTVDGTGWPPRDSFRHLGIHLCPADEDQCDRLATGFEAEADGTFHREVHARTVFEAFDGTTIDCRAVACHLLVDESTTHPRVRVPLTFDPDAPLLPDPVLAVTPDQDLIRDQPVTLHGTGFFPDEPLLLTICAPGLDPFSCAGLPVQADGSGELATTATPRIFQLQWHGGYDCRSEPFCSFSVLDPNDRALRASAPQHLRPDGDEVITVTPTDGLAENATVTVHASGLNEAYDGWVAQCWHDPAFHQPWATCATDKVPFTVGPSREHTARYPVRRHITITRANDGVTIEVDCAIDSNCTLDVGGDAVDALLHNGMGDSEARVETPLSFAGATTPATPTAVTPAFAG